MYDLLKTHVHTIMVSIVEMRFLLLLLFLFVFYNLVELVIFPVALEFLTLVSKCFIEELVELI